MSRIFEALRQSEKANGKNPPSPPADKGSHWGDLRSALESWSASAESGNDGVAQAVSQKGNLGRLENPRVKEAPNPVADVGGRLREMAAQANLPPDIVEDVESVVCQPRAEERVLRSGQFHDSTQEVFRVLCQSLLQVREQRAFRTVLVTSAVPHEGKTVVAINVAATFARNSSAVLLVDADLRHPRHATLGIAAGPGLAEYLEGRIEFAKALRRVTPLGLYFVAAGIASMNPAELFQKPALQEFIRQAAYAFEWVILDSPSVNLFADPRHLARLVDGVLLVVREGVTPKDAAGKSLAALEKAFVIGTVFNASTDSPHAHYDLSEPPHLIDKDETVLAAKPLTEKRVGNDPVAPRVSPGLGGLRL